jgi:hypothetical protein
MLEFAARFVSLFSIGLVSGIALCVLLVERVWAGNGQFYTQLMQLLNRALTVPTTLLGAVGLVATATDAALLSRRGAGAALWLAGVAVLLNVAALALTKLGHFPINDLVLKWDAVHPPADWTHVQARWSALHVVRTICGVGTFALLILSNLLRS